MSMVLTYFLGRDVREASPEPERPGIAMMRDTAMMRQFKAMSADAPHAEHATEQLEDILRTVGTPRGIAGTGSPPPSRRGSRRGTPREQEKLSSENRR